MLSRAYSQLQKRSLQYIQPSLGSHLKSSGCVVPTSRIFVAQFRSFSTGKPTEAPTEGTDEKAHPVRVAPPSRSRRVILDGETPVNPVERDDTETAQELHDSERFSTVKNPRLQRGEDIESSRDPVQRERAQEYEEKHASARKELRRRLVIFITALIVMNLAASYLRNSSALTAHHFLEKRESLSTQLGLVFMMTLMSHDRLLDNASFIMRKLLGTYDKMVDSLKSLEKTLVTQIVKLAEAGTPESVNQLAEVLRVIEASNKITNPAQRKSPFAGTWQDVVRELAVIIDAESKKATFRHPGRFAHVPVKQLIDAYSAEGALRVAQEDLAFFRQLLEALQKRGKTAGDVVDGSGLGAPQDSFAITLNGKSDDRFRDTFSSQDGFNKAPEHAATAPTTVSAYDPQRRAAETTVSSASPQAQRDITLGKLERALAQHVELCVQVEEAARAALRKYTDGGHVDA